MLLPQVLVKRFLLNDLEVFLGDEVPIGVEAKFIFPRPGKN